MHLTASEKNLIQASYIQLMKNEQGLAHCFYDVLFEMAPLIKPLFKGDRQLLEVHFNELICVAVEHVSHFEKLQLVLNELGIRHKAYGAKVSQFEIVKVALLLSIEYELKGQFNTAIKNAWAKYVDQISNEMMVGLLSQ
tara:strand:+ start:767 stop:1183 length:417 start_codon:yes stop_codon:yes gene_type:complete